MEGWANIFGEILGRILDKFPAPEIKSQKIWVNRMISILWFIGICLACIAMIFGIVLFVLRAEPFIISEIGILVTGAILLLPFIISLLFCLVGKSSRKALIKNLGKERVVLHRSKFYFWVGIVGAVLLSIFTLYVFLHVPANKLELYAILVGLWGLIPYTIIPYLTWKIEFSRSTEYLVYRNIIGISYKIRYEDILYYENHTQSIVVKTKRKKFSVGYEVTNYERLIEAFSDHGIDRLRFYAWQKEKNSAAPEQDNEPDALPKPRKRRFYKGKGPY